MANTSISEVRICNMALSRLGASGTIEDLNENSAEAQACNLWYNYARKQSLAGFDWSFARKRLTLATHSDPPPDGVWAYRYQYPSDCEIMRKIQNPSGAANIVRTQDSLLDPDAIPFEIELDSNQETKSILSDLDDAVGVYTFDLTEVTLFSEFFISLLATNIAAYIAFSVTGKQDMEEKMAFRYAQLLQTAPASNANEQVGRPPRDAEWIRGRF